MCLVGNSTNQTCCCTDETAIIVFPPVQAKSVQAHNQQSGILLHAQVQQTGSTGPDNTCKVRDLLMYLLASVSDNLPLPCLANKEDK